MSTIFLSNIGSHNLLQQVSSSQNLVFSTNSTSYQPTYLSCGIVPSFSSSLILVVVTAMAGMTAGSNNGYLTVYRGGTNLFAASSFGGSTIAGHVPSIPAGIFHPVVMTFYDAPGSTLTQVYKVYIQSGDSGTTINFGYSASMTQYMTLIEIAQ